MYFKVQRTVCILILIGISQTTPCESKKILCLLGVGTESAQEWNKVLLNQLSTKGHDLTILTPTLWDMEAETNIQFIHLEKTKQFLERRYKENNNMPNLLQQSTWKLIINWYDQQMATCRGNLESAGLSQALQLAVKGKHSFDLIIYDVTHGPGCLLHMAHLFSRIPIVGITSSSLTSDILSINQNSVLNAAVDPYALSDLGSDMNYWKRLYNTALYGFDYAYRKWVVQTVLEGFWSHYAVDKNIYIAKSANELSKRLKLILANHYPALHTLTSLPLNVVAVPGLHIKNKTSSILTTDLSKFIENFAIDTRIVVIDLDLKELGETNVQLIFEAISQFPSFGFIWRVNNRIDMLKNKLNNLYVEDKLESQELFGVAAALAGKIKFALTIPELLRVQECLFYAIPMIAITLKPEQFYLAKRIQEQGFGINLQLHNLNNLSSSFDTILTNINFHNTVMQLQKSLVNQQNTPLDTAVWCVENLLENPQAYDHLYTANKNTLNFFATSALDIILLLEVLILMCILNVVLVWRQTLNNFRRISKTTVNKSIEKKEGKIKKLKKDKKDKIK